MFLPLIPSDFNEFLTWIAKQISTMNTVEIKWYYYNFDLDRKFWKWITAKLRNSNLPTMIIKFNLILSALKDAQQLIKTLTLKIRKCHRDLRNSDTPQIMRFCLKWKKSSIKQEDCIILVWLVLSKCIMDLQSCA